MKKKLVAPITVKTLLAVVCWVVVFVIFYLIYFTNKPTTIKNVDIPNHQPKLEETHPIIKDTETTYKQPKLETNPIVKDAETTDKPTTIKNVDKPNHQPKLEEAQPIIKDAETTKRDDLNIITPIIRKKFCVSNEALYFGQLTHNGNLNGQMKQIYETIHTRSKLPFLKKENTFLFTDVEPSQDFIGNYSRITFKTSKVQERGYEGAQKRFLESIFAMLEIKKERNDEKVRWFMISDDDHFVIPANLMKTLAKYDHLLEKGDLSLDKPIIIGRTPSCLHVSGGAGVIFNQKAIEILSVHMNDCIQKYGLQWYDYTIYRCVDGVITKSTEEKCSVLKHETSMHCCNYMYFCDTSSFNDPPNLSWFNRFRRATGLHYIQGPDNIRRVKENIPELFFTQIDTCFDVKELEDELDGYMITGNSTSQSLSDIMKLVSKLKKPKHIDWALKEEKQADSQTVSKFMINLIEIIYSSWENQFFSKRQAIENSLEKHEISILLIPSTHIKSHHLIDSNYDPTNNIQSSIQYWKNNGFNVHYCNSTMDSSKLSLYGDCFKQMQYNKFKWTIVVTETTRSNVNSLLSYLKTYKSDEVLFIGAMSSGLQLILSQIENKESKIIGLPFGSTFSVSRPFISEYLSIYNSNEIGDHMKQSKINEELLKPNTRMMLSGGQFFKHAPEHYCTRGIQNLDSWIEMQVPTKFIEPISVTLPPTSNCNGRLDSISQFLNRNDRSLLTSATGFAHHCFE